MNATHYSMDGVHVYGHNESAKFYIGTKVKTEIVEYEGVEGPTEITYEFDLIKGEYVEIGREGYLPLPTGDEQLKAAQDVINALLLGIGGDSVVKYVEQQWVLRRIDGLYLDDAVSRGMITSDEHDNILKMPQMKSGGYVHVSYWK